MKDYPILARPIDLIGDDENDCASCRSSSAARGWNAFVKKLDDPRIDLVPTGPTTVGWH